jgi:zinc-ribbon domain
MYCPRCAAQSLDDAKFCRSCGADLKVVALALAEQQLPSKAGENETKAPEKEQTWTEKRSQGVRKAAEGATMLVGSLLICLAIHFSNNHDPLGIWVVFFGWMACWGVFAIASGLGAIMQAASMGSKAALPKPADEPVKVPDTDPLADPSPSPLLSVTEDTTRSLEPTPKEYATKE